MSRVFFLTVNVLPVYKLLSYLLSAVQVNGILTSSRSILDAGNLTVWNLGVGDQGIYECVASNVIGDVITSSLLVVECQ